MLKTFEEWYNNELSNAISKKLLSQSVPTRWVYTGATLRVEFRIMRNCGMINLRCIVSLNPLIGQISLNSSGVPSIWELKCSGWDESATYFRKPHTN